MDFKTAMSRVSRQSPCAHETHTLLGVGHYVKCEDCGGHVTQARLPHAKKATDEYQEALNYLASLGPKSAPGQLNPTPAQVEEVPVVLEFLYGGERTQILSLTQAEWGLPVPVKGQLVYLNAREYLVSQVHLAYIQPPNNAQKTRSIVVLLC